MLDGLRVLDLADDGGQLAGMILAGLGADVIAVEPSGGRSSRSLAPFAGDVEDPDGSVVHWATNRGKRSIELDLTSAEGAADFERLLAHADVLIDTASPAQRAAEGLDPERLAGINPALVQVSITGFGTFGPKAGWEGPDLVALAAGGQLILSGDADRAPVRCSVPQAWAHASGDAVDAVLIALWERRQSGLGQHCDVSVQQSVMQATQSLVLNHAFGVELGARVGGGMRLGPLDIQLVWPCLDGTVSITFLFGASAGPFSGRLFEWMYEEGACEQADRDIDWEMFGTLIHNGDVPVSAFDHLKHLLAAFCLTKTKQELFDAALERKLLIAPASSIADVVETPHFIERDYWDRIPHPAVKGPIRQPGPIVKPSYGRLPELGPAPRLGEHTQEILAALTDTVPSPVAGTEGGGSGAGPLAGLKVLDFMWSLAGPAITRVLADYGATVVRVESSNRIEMGRTLNPFWQDKTDPEASGVFLNANAGKLDICLDLNIPEGREVAIDLARWADVVTESYSPRAMVKWGLDYETLRGVNPGLVMMSSSLAGHTGPLASFAGFGNLASALAGFFHTTGWPDRTCVGPYGGYTDYLSPRFAVAALMAGLHRQARTGEGCYLDFSQAEGAMWALGPAFAEFEVNGRVWERAGNSDRNHAPHVVAPTAGDDRWIAVVCETDQQWRSLCKLAGFDPSLAGLGAAERVARSDELEGLVAAWTADQEGPALAGRLQAAGVPAHHLADAADLWADEHLAARSHWAWVEHAMFGQIPIEGSRFALSRTPTPPLASAPTLGQHTFEILQDILGYDSDRIADLAAAEVLE
jgi:crotonobetainyl-CoA:carnitine CoA-transferase CaiB-like acyl-CoA transferase